MKRFEPAYDFSSDLFLCRDQISKEGQVLVYLKKVFVQTTKKTCVPENINVTCVFKTTVH